MKKILTGMLMASFFLTQAQIKISALPAASTPVGTEVLPVVQSGVTKKISIAQLTNFALASDSFENKAWLTSGNSLTNPSTNYFGCADTNVLFIKMYSTDDGLIKSGSIDGSHANTSFGFGSLSHVTPFLGSNNYGEENTSFGTATLISCDSCNGNTALGAFSLLSLTNGRRNVSVGGAALYNCTTGSSNVAVGANSLVDNIDGSFNTAIGDSCLTFLQHGQYNTALGDSSLYTLTYGNYNIAIGHDASTTTDSASCSIALGAHVRAASNQFSLTDSITNLKWRLNGQTSGYGLVTNGTTANWQRVSIITSGTSAPATTPNKVGDIFIDTSAKKLYFATGNSSSADWTIAN